jgi:hypothetical protein
MTLVIGKLDMIISMPMEPMKADWVWKQIRKNTARTAKIA